MMNKLKQLRLLDTSNLLLLFICILIVISTSYRLNIALNSKPGGDLQTHIRAVEELNTGINPYLWTIESFHNDKDPNNKGYAYFPSIMYVNTPLRLLSIQMTNSYSDSITLMSKLYFLPGIIANVFICMFFIVFYYRINKFAMLFSLIFWLFNPYFVLKQNLLAYDAITIAFLLWALYFLQKDDVISGVLFAIAFSFKTFPIILLFVFLLKSKSAIKFILSGAFVGLFLSIPFLKSFFDFSTYLKGAFFVHGNRFIQGRPFLFYISYFYKVELFQIIPFKFYSIGSIVFGWISSVLLYFTNLIKNKYALSVFPFIIFYVLTPVLNRTYVVWGIPFFLVGFYNLFGKKYKFLFYGVNVFYWFFIYWYLGQWKDGFHIWRP